MAYPSSTSLKHKEEEWGWDSPLRAPIPPQRQCSGLDGRRSGAIHAKGVKNGGRLWQTSFQKSDCENAFSRRRINIGRLQKAAPKEDQ